MERCYSPIASINLEGEKAYCIHSRGGECEKGNLEGERIVCHAFSSFSVVRELKKARERDDEIARATSPSSRIFDDAYFNGD